jgi:hypothetical protein
MASVNVAIRQSQGETEKNDEGSRLRYSITRPRLEPIENSLLFSAKMDFLEQAPR